jgi:hypothetical protein
LQKSGAGRDAAKNQLDTSTRRLSRMSLEDDGAANMLDADRMKGVREAVTEGS